jgi:DNA topoisomerase-1
MAVMSGTAYLEKKQFLDNFWKAWKPILGPNHVIKDLKKCDFTPIYEWHMAERERKKALPKEVRLSALFLSYYPPWLVDI